MSLQRISLGLTSNPGKAPAAGSARLINVYAEIAGKEQHEAEQLWAVDGMTLWASSIPKPVRAMIDVDGTIYAVAGRRIYRVDASGTATDIGGIASDKPVTMARNRRPVPQIGIVSQDGQYVVIEGGTVSDCTSLIRGGVNSIAFLNGYFVFSHDDGTISTTDIDDAKSADPLSYSGAESSPDPAIRVVSRQREAVVFGTLSVEFFGDIGGDPFPLGKNQQIEIGCAAAGSVAALNQTVAWIGHNHNVYILNGYEAVRISNHALERVIAKEPSISTIVATTWHRDGHTFYAISGTNWTWVYDIISQQWHERQSYGLDRWRASCITESNGELVVGCYNTGDLYKLDRDAATEGDDPIVCKIITPPSHAYPSRLKINALFLDVIPGVGRNVYDPLYFGVTLAWGGDVLTWGDDELAWGVSALAESSIDPDVMMRASFDGGKTWTAEQRAKLGQMHEGMRRVVFRRLGMTRQLGITFEISCSAAVMRGFMGATLDVDKAAA